MAPRKTQKQYVSIQELAKELGVSPSLLYGQVREGKVPGATRIGQRISIHMATFMKSMGHDGNEQETPASDRDLFEEAVKRSPRLAEQSKVEILAASRAAGEAEAVAAELRPPKKVEEPLQAWTELAEKKPLRSSDTFQYYNHLSTRNVPEEIIDRIQDLRSKGLKLGQILVSMGIEASNARLRGLNPPPVPKMNTVARYSKEFDRHGSRSLKRTQGMTEPDAAEEPRHVAHTDVVSWPTGSLLESEGVRLYDNDDNIIIGEVNYGETVRLIARRSFTCANCKEVKMREEKMVLAVCRPGRRDIEKDIVSYALCGTKCAKEFIDQKDEAEWLNTPIGRQLTTEELKAEGWIEVPTFSTPENTETSGSLWRKLRNLAGGSE